MSLRSHLSQPSLSSIVAKLSFLPPEPTYHFAFDNPTPSMLLLSGEGDRSVFSPPYPIHLVADIHTRRGNVLAGFYLEIPGSEFTIIYSHGNAVGPLRLAR